jgi:serine/threonine-protein kinase HipA
MDRPDCLDVYYGSERVGTIYDTSPVAFEYTPTWLQRPERMSVAAIALQPGRHDSAPIQAFFENLLPEGELRHYLAEQRKASTLFSLLLQVAGDTAGGFVIVPGGQHPEAATYEATSWEAIATFLGKNAASAIELQGEDARVSLAGAQDKTGIAIFEDGLPRLPKGTSPSTHILKPNIKRLSKVWHSAANETIVMRAAAHCGLPTAEVFYEPHTESCVVRRFDRVARPDGTLSRLVQYDLCQLAGTLSERKYEKEGGPGLATCAELIRHYSSQPAVDLRHFVGWIFFNLYAGNNDSHAKNLSIYHVPAQGVRLTPFYDLMCTRLYPGLSREFAFAIGGDHTPASLTKANLLPLAEQLRMRPQFLAQQAADLARRMPAALDQAMAEVRPALPYSARTLAGRLQRFVLSTTTTVAACLAG